MKDYSRKSYLVDTPYSLDKGFDVGRLFTNPTVREHIEKWRHSQDRASIDGGKVYARSLEVTAIKAYTFTLDKTGYIRSFGKNNYDDTTAGFFLGYDTDAYKINIGDATSYIKWDGSTLTVTGSVAAASVEVGTSGYVRTTGKTSYADTDAGFWLGYDSTAYKLNIGNATSYIKWDGSALTITGNVTAASVEVGTSGYVRTTGKTSYADTDAGFWLGYDSGAYKFNIGNATDFFKWDGTNISMSTGKAAGITLISGGDLKVEGGGDILLIGSDSDPGTLILDGTSYNTNIGINASGSIFEIMPATTNQVYFRIGYNAAGLFNGSRTTFKQGQIACEDLFEVVVGNDGALGDYVELLMQTDQSTYSRFWFQAHIDGSDAIVLEDTSTAQIYFGPVAVNKAVNLGRAGYAWDEAYADNWNNEADFYHMDERINENGEIETIDDLKVIHDIKPLGEYDEVTGFRKINDSSLPGWLVVKHKRDGSEMNPYTNEITRWFKKGDVAYSIDGKPYLSTKTMLSLLMGAVRQLDNKIKALGG